MTYSRRLYETIVQVLLWYQVKFVEDSKGCLPQILLGPFLNTLSHLLLITFWIYIRSFLMYLFISSNSLLTADNSSKCSSFYEERDMDTSCILQRFWARGERYRELL